jgi:hypothetical protein
MKAAFALTMALPLVLSVTASADNGNHFGRDSGNNGNHYGQVRGAPGPLAGASLPVILVGAGIYWLVRRRKKNKQIGG